MPYASIDDITAEINSQDLIPFLDDEGTGQLNTTRLQSIIDRESNKVDAFIGSIYVTPVVPTPPALRNACIVFTNEALYRRRLTPDEKNPFHAEAEDLRKWLQKVGSGEAELDQSVARAFVQGAVIQTPMAVNTTLM